MFTIKNSSSPLIKDQKTLHCSTSSGVNRGLGSDFEYSYATAMFLTKINGHFSMHNDFMYTLTTFLIL